MSMIDSLLPMSTNSNNNNNKYYDYGSPTHNSFLLSPSSSSSIIKNSNNNSNYSILQNIIPGEEICTIFVVGFPDNMQEREFQNMFMFSPGFEAATLKVPTINSMLTISSSNTIEDENNRKQIIGFAKFRTRLEALDAKEVLNGKKIDQEKGCILKAEMAKKNLHTKKEQQQQSMLIKSPYEAFHSVPIIKDTPRIIPTTTKSSTCTYTPNNSLFGMLANNNNHHKSSTSTVDYPFLLHKLYNNNNNHHTSLPPPPPSSFHQQQQHQKQQLSQQDIMTQLLVSSSASTPILPKESDFYNNRLLLNTMDQNPPCNTLYVGNLPINTNEEELRMIFSNCNGYKRLSFRTKSNNGPMCFVEFEDIHYATIALQELNGNPLSNSIKGGIRLSFSKNPLGVRQNIVH